MVSEEDLLQQGKEVPGGAAALREMIDQDQEATKSGSVDDTQTSTNAKPAEQQLDTDLVAGASDSGHEQQQEQEEVQPSSDKPAEQQGTADAVAADSRPHALTRDLVGKVAKDNTIMVTWANWHYHDFVMNWVEHLQAAGCDAFIVGAMDDKLLEFLVSKNIPAFSMSSGLTLGDFGWGTPTFHKMGREKINLIYSFTKMGYDVLISDVDTVWLRNPLPYINAYRDADILTSSDHLRNTVQDEGLEKWPEAASAANIGIMLFRPRAHDLAAEWVDILENDANVWDQNAFNDLFRRGSKPLPDRTDRLFECYNGKLKCGILPVSIFCSGHTGFTQRMPDKLGLQPYVVHATFQYSGTPGKRHRMRERLWWNDPGEYFSHPKGFIAYDGTVPPMLLEAAQKVQRDFSLQATMPHFNLVNHQIKQMRAAFALAQARIMYITGRAVILPKLMCGMDRWWAPHDGTIPGSGLDLPYICPADHVLDLEAMSNTMPENEFGPNIEFREYSFLQNQHAAALNASVLTLDICQDASTCADGADKLKPQLHEEALKAALTEGKVAEAKVLHFVGGIERLFGGWTDEAAGERFKRRLDRYGSIWCCVNAHPGHIWYDFFFDQLPHQDRHGRTVEKTWEPVTGP
ncbi:hypothetical protein CHLNCDRAFT_37217 [Chlorella variabilis]|uniref:Nucleotide-diphospho-sugar transferase domain-containing protein n=1 Tax=Chlorella variabilis TaxID=554065 RepID=E1ZQS5_CHLVA|nr:hypothetical protein CHLNCDRAFT_37217 [Chlorella variabilis]EFN51848.1 hypothetical protein CHLNCDRAFT_37217 [Chlorella variabilis]|eukprot:XP_005843950.1 hypothetical protein CHLNCDRAFT_37217 [Chlorella variabilis]